MAHNQGAPPEEQEEGMIKSEFQDTLEAIQQRRQFFQVNHLSHECEMLQYNTSLIRTIGEVFPVIATYLLNQSPVQPILRDIYTSQYDNQPPRCILPPPSEGEESINQPTSYVPTFEWLSNTIIDSNMLIHDQPQPKKIDKKAIPVEWENNTEILLHFINKKIHLKSQIKSVEDSLKKFVDRNRCGRIKKIKPIYLKGKPSVIIKFGDQVSSGLAYFYLSNDTKRGQLFGINSEVFRVTENKLKEMPNQKSVYIIFRQLPMVLSKQGLLQILKKRGLTPIWMEELIHIQSFKYTLCKIKYLQNAFDICTQFQIKPPYKGIKVNLHPKSSKTWASQTNQELAVEPIL